MRRSAIAVALIGFAAVGVAWWSLRAPARFDPVRWKTAHEVCKADCGDMVEDVRNHYVSGGAGQRRVAELLGEPEYVNLERTPERGRVWWSWNIGRALIDCATLDVLFENHRLVRSETGHT